MSAFDVQPPSIQPPHTPSFASTVLSYAAVQTKVLLRLKTPVIFIFAVPILLSAILGPSVSGLDPDQASFRGVLGFAVMFSFMVVNYAGLAFFDEYVDNTCVRQSLYEPAKLAFIMGKLVPPCALALTQLIGFWAFGVFFLDVPVDGASFLLLPVALLLVATGAGIGTLLFGVTRTPQTFQSLTYLVLICGAALGGAIVAPSRLPAVSRSLGLAMPHYWALRAVDEVTLRGGDLSAILGSTLVLALMATLTLLGGAKMIDYRAEKFAIG